ncbi:MAG: substrate-binding domain-containing protein [Planctomycetes bacterium]|nr:substrate-binding domain-containing protein [Planctomycetota bacterium]
MLRLRRVILAGLVAFAAACGKGPPRPLEELRILHAAGLTPLVDALREDCARTLGIEIVNEPGPSQVVCRKISELRKPCDLLMLADPELVAELLGGVASFRIDFASDSMVLGVGRRAPLVDEAEADWPSVLLRDDVSLARADEEQAPTGYRTFFVWKLMEAKRPGLFAALRAKPAQVVENVSILAALLESGSVDYAFLYRSTCLAQGIRFIELDPAVNLGNPETDYSAATLELPVRGTRGDRTLRVAGMPVYWCLTVPDAEGLPAKTRRFIEYLLMKRSGLLEALGLRPLAPPVLRGRTGAATQRARDLLGTLVRFGGDLR